MEIILINDDDDDDDDDDGIVKCLLSENFSSVSLYLFNYADFTP